MAFVSALPRLQGPRCGYFFKEEKSHMKINKTRMICEAAIFIAMAEILSLIKLY